MSKDFKTRQAFVKCIAEMLLVYGREDYPDNVTVSVESVMYDVADFINDKLKTSHLAKIVVMDGHAASGCDC